MTGFLFDENLPKRVRFTPSLPVAHTSSLGESLSDLQIWEYARSHGLAIVSKDADFSDRVMLDDPPPWVIRLRFGNLRLAAFHERPAKAWPLVEALLPSHKLVCVYEDRVEGVRG